MKLIITIIFLFLIILYFFKIDENFAIKNNNMKLNNFLNMCIKFLIKEKYLLSNHSINHSRTDYLIGDGNRQKKNYYIEKNLKYISSPKFINQFKNLFKNIYSISSLDFINNNNDMYIIPQDIIIKKNLYKNFSNVIFMGYYNFYFFTNDITDIHELRKKKIAVLYLDDLSYLYIQKIMSNFNLKQFISKKITTESDYYYLEKMSFIEIKKKMELKEIDCFFIYCFNPNKYVKYFILNDKINQITFNKNQLRNLSLDLPYITIKSFNKYYYSIKFKDINNHEHHQLKIMTKNLAIPAFLIISKNKHRNVIKNFLNFIRINFYYLHFLKILPNYNDMFKPNLFIDNHIEVMIYLRENGFISDNDSNICKYFIGSQECTKNLIKKYNNFND